MLSKTHCIVYTSCYIIYTLVDCTLKYYIQYFIYDTFIHHSIYNRLDIVRQYNI